jgi:hypothetical protein
VSPRLARLPLLLPLLLAGPVLARAWNGIEPGVTPREEVVKRFGPPTKTLVVDGRQVLAYTGSAAIKGTAQAQFRVDPTTGVVERIDVFPGPVVDRETVESTYGPPCPAAGAPPASGACFQKKLTDDFRTYYVYPRLGLAVFFDEDGDKVQSFVFQPVKPPRAP